MNVAVVILNWNGKKLLEKFLPSVIYHSRNAKIYVADNASTDDSIDFTEKNFPEVEIIKNIRNAGYAGGYNLALKSVSEEIQILLNSDVEVTQGWLEPIISTFNNEQEVAAIQPKILDYQNRNLFEYAGAAGGFIDKYGYPYCKGRIFQSLEEDHGQFNEDDYVFWASGACIAVRKSAFDKIGGFDEDFFAHQEEIDLCWRLQNSGYKIKYVANSQVYHVGGATLATMNPKKTFYNFRNSLFLLYKNLPPSQLYSVLFVRMILDGIAAFKFICEGKFNHFFIVLEAHASFYRHFGRMNKKRPNKFILSKYYSISSIVYQHFILKKDTYKGLDK